MTGTRKTTKVQVDDARKRAEVEKIKEQVRQGGVANPNVIVIPQSDLQRMRVNCDKLTSAYSLKE